METETEDPTLQTNVLPELPFEDDGTPDVKPPVTPPTGDDAAAPPEGDDLRTAMTELAGTVKSLATPRREQPAPTQEQIAEYWRIYDPEKSDKEFFKKFGRFDETATPEQVQAYKEMFLSVRDGIMQQAVAATRNYLQAARSEIDETYGPVREYMEQTRREATRGRFYDGYPVLKEDRFQKIIDATARSIENKQFQDEKSYFKALAEGAADSIRAILPEFELGSKPQTKQPPGKPPKLPRTTAGGGGGAGKAGHDVLQPTGQGNDIDSLESETE